MEKDLFRNIMMLVKLYLKENIQKEKEMEKEKNTIKKKN